MKWVRTGWFLAISFVAGCDLVSEPPPDGTTDTTSLKAFTSEQEFRDYVRTELTARNGVMSDTQVLFNRDGLESAPSADADGAAPTPAVPGSAGAAGGDEAINADGTSSGYSQTTIQESGVDEADVVKTDGTYLYVIDDTTEAGSTLRIVRASPPEQIAVVGEFALEGYGREIYLHDGKVVAVTATYGNIVYLSEPAIALPPAAEGGGGSSESGAAQTAPSVEGDAEVGVEVESEGDVAVDADPGKDDAVVVIDPLPMDSILPPYSYERPRVIVTVVDTSDTANPRLVSKTKLDGSSASSRMIAGVLHLVLANYQNYYFDVMPLLGRPQFDAGEVDTTTVLPRYEQTDAAGNVTSGDLLTWADVYHPVEPDGFGVVAVTSLDVVNNSSLRATGVLAEPGLIYSSLGALYLTNTDYDFAGNMRTSTKLYKLAYSDGRATPVAAGSVPGRILNQYSLGEYNGVLRVATTVDPVFSHDGQLTSANNNVFCLADESGTLQTIGRLENFAPRETIQSARFVGERGFVVTFERIDPLFTLDLSDPRNPRIVGELEVPGFSTFMVPMDDNHLLAVGQYISEDQSRSWGVQLSIFDVTHFANPVRTHNVVLGGGEQEGGAWSEALYDPKALTYFADAGLLALPVNIYPRYEYFRPAEPLPTDVRDPATGGDIDRPEEEPAGEGGSGSSGSAGSSDTGIAVGEPSPPQPFEGLLVYRVSVEGGFVELGRIDTRFEQPGYYSWTSFTRGVFIDENVYAVSNLGVRAAPVNDVASAPFELFYGKQYPIEPLPVPGDPIFFDDGVVEPDGSVLDTMGFGGAEGTAGTEPAEPAPGQAAPISSPKK